MIYLYITPSGSVNLQDADKMPDSADYAENFQDGSGTGRYDSKGYEADLESAKASSVPVDDQERALYTIFSTWRDDPAIEDPMPFGVWKLNAMKKDHFYGPFDNYPEKQDSSVGKLEEKETPEQFYARSRYPEMKDKFDKSAARFSYDDMMQFADDYAKAIKQ